MSVTYSEAQFNEAVKIIQNLPKDGPVQPSQEDKLIFYGYYKQATVGDVNVPKPGLFDFVGQAKWGAWNSVYGTSKEKAWTEYVAKFLEILKDANNEESKEYIAKINAA